MRCDIEASRVGNAPHQHPDAGCFDLRAWMQGSSTAGRESTETWTNVLTRTAERVKQLNTGTSDFFLWHYWGTYTEWPAMPHYGWGVLFALLAQDA